MRSDILENMEQAIKEKKEIDLADQSVLSEDEYNDLAAQQNTKADDIIEEQVSEEEFKAAQAEVKEVVRNLKKRFKGLSKTELIYIIVEQISRAEKFQDLAKNLYEDNKKLLEELEKQNA